MHDKSGTPNQDSEALAREVVLTEDGSVSIKIPEMNEMYHSRKGAIKESIHVYIDHGLKLSSKNPVRVLEIGMGTGLNVLLSHLKSSRHGISLEFHTLEPYPLLPAEYSQLNYEEILDTNSSILQDIHSCPWGKTVELGENFKLTKHQTKLEDFDSEMAVDVIYFDAFAPSKQAKPWQLSNLSKCYNLLETDGLLVTYCSQGQFKRDLATVGFRVTNPEGPMGKREITVAYK